MATHPENTIAGFLHAMTCGADGVELDVAVTLDNRLVVTHDPVREAAASLPFPTLDEVLALPAPSHFWFDVEAKSAPGWSPDPPYFAQLLSDVICRSPALQRVQVRSFNHDILRAFHTAEPSIPLAALIDYASDDWVAIARSAGASIISPHYSTATPERITRAHEAGIRVSVWTVNSAADWQQLAALGIDTLITDDPGAALRHLHQFR
jgi:glycerophosphoryl diester phosphodiesterase